MQPDSSQVLSNIT